MTARALALPLVLGFVGSFIACKDDGGDVGAPCNEDDDCEADLACDVHEGHGSCQEPHDHDHDHEPEPEASTGTSTGG